MKITLTGSLGNISKPLATTLIQHGHKVSIISSTSDRANEIESIGAIPLVGNLNDIGFLTDSMKGADAAYCMIPPNFSHPDQMDYYQTMGRNYASAIQRSGVKRVVHLSSYGAHLPSGTGFISGSYRTEQILNEVANIKLTHIRPTFFYYNLLPFIEMIKTAGFIGTVYGGEDKLALVSPDDIADVVAEELQKDDGKRIRLVTSDERSCNDIAKVLGKAIGIPTLKWLVIPAGQVMKSLQGRGVSENVARNLVELGEALHSGRLLEDYELNKPQFGKVKLEDYAVKFAEIFNRK